MTVPEHYGYNQEIADLEHKISDLESELEHAKTIQGRICDNLEGALRVIAVMNAKIGELEKSLNRHEERVNDRFLRIKQSAYREMD